MKKKDQPTTFQGRPCKRGHSGERYMNGKHCVECAKNASSKQYSLLLYKKGIRRGRKRTGRKPKAPDFLAL